MDNLFPGEALVLLKGRPARVLGDQIRSIHRKRLRGRLARLRPDELQTVDEALRITLNL